MGKERRLGRGLAELLKTSQEEPPVPRLAEPPEETTPQETPDAPSASEPAPVEAPPTDGLLHLGVYEIDDNPFQPRRDFSEPEIASLAESLKQHDMLQPILVRKVGERFQLISGERRLRAAIKAGWATVPARLREADDRLVAELAIVENLQRQDLNPIEKAMSFKRYLEQHECTQEQLASRLQLDRSTIANALRLLDLPEEVCRLLREGTITAGHARALLPLGDEPQQIDFCRRITSDGLSVRAVEQLVSDTIRQEEDELQVVGSKSAKSKPSRSQQVAALERELRIALGTKVEIRESGRGRGKIVVHFTSHKEFDRLRDLFTDDGAEYQEQAG